LSRTFLALGSPRTKYRLVTGKAQTPLQEYITGRVRESRWEIRAELCLDAIMAEEE